MKLKLEIWCARWR